VAEADGVLTDKDLGTNQKYDVYSYPDIFMQLSH
jgi:hypothetical protein